LTAQADYGTQDASNRTVFVFTDVRMHRDRFGRLRAGHSAGAYRRWLPYVAAFGSVNVVSRIEEGLDDGLLADGPGMSSTPLLDYKGGRQFIMRLPALLRAINRLGDQNSLFVGRLPEPLSLLAYVRSRLVGANFIAYVVAEPRELMHVSINGAPGWILGALLSLTVKRVVSHCEGVIYVTENWLQSRYPARTGVPVLARSNVFLPEEAFTRPSAYKKDQAMVQMRLVSIGGLQSLTKGHDMLIRVLERLHKKGIPAKLVIVGGGRNHKVLADLASELGVGSSVRLVGHLDRVAEVHDLLDQAHVYVSGSRSEGLPRATVEAMARGLTVVSTDVGGTCELLPSRYLVQVDAVDEMAGILQRLAGDQAERRAAGVSNKSRAREIAKLATDERLVTYLEQYYCG
jgi:phosphatidyl-myo-inositol dimannoside synthase